ncbi:MAG: type II toxin-antitoxin system Phd/YefM family antitoxin [Spirochaetia bacterium]|jgi:antitoxin (DNA-binding transcriptional repressor) of toxin-antitoxin stability system|nr:type II toxin-antitoxin system Phd/YefM family antitoxin [Spirochaetia bacterium]
MKFISVRDFRTSPAQIWKRLPEEQEMIITNNGKPIALLTPLNDSTLEETVSAFRKAKAINVIKLMQQKSITMKNDEMSLEDINTEIMEVRKNKKK